MGAVYALSVLAGRVIVLPQDDFARELYFRFVVVFVFTFIGFLQVMFSIILINYIATIMSNRIVLVKDNKTELLVFIQEYLDYRNLLQVCLIATGILLSLNTIITAAFYLTWKETGAFTAATFPSETIISYGLIYTLLIMLTYVPAFFTLMNVGRELRDAKYPLDVDTLEVTMKNRKLLDDLLQINFGITANLKNGIFILTPLISGLLASLLGFK